LRAYCAAERKQTETTVMTKLLGLGLVLLASSLFGMAGAQVELPGPSKDAAAAEAPIPDEPRLKTRILDFYRALGARNAQVLYEMQTPYLRSDRSFDDFKREVGLDEAWLSQPATKLTVELDQRCFCLEWQYPDGTSAQRCVLLLRGVEEGTGAQPGTGKRLLAMWDYTNGEWFYGSPGEGDHCPSDAEVRRGTPQGPQAAAGAPAGLPDEARLKARIKAYSKAVESKDSRAMYEMQTPYIRSHMSFDDYKRDWRLDEAWSKQPRMRLTSELDRSCSCADWMYPDGSRTLRCVLLLKGTYGKAGARPQQVKWLDMWEYANGEWYYGYPGEGDRCPSETPPARATSEEVTLPDEARLKVRMQDFYDAIVSQDARKLYEMRSSGGRSSVPFEKFQQYGVPLLRKVLVGAPTKVTVGLEQICACRRTDFPYDRIVCEVLVDEVQGSVPGAKQMKRHVDHWEYTNGEWFFWFWFPEVSEQCPPKEGE